MPLLNSADTVTAPEETAGVAGVNSGGGLAVGCDETTADETTAFVGAADITTGGAGLVSGRVLACGTAFVCTELAGGSGADAGPLIIISCVGGGGGGLVIAEFPMIINGGTVEAGGGG